MAEKPDRWLATALLLLTAGIAANSILGPLMSGIVRYPFSSTVRNMTIGLDAVSLFFVAPIGFIAAGYVYRGQQIGYITAISSSAYAMYTFVQLILGPQYIEYSPVVLLHLAIFLLSGFILVNAWHRIRVNALPDLSRRKKTISATIFILLAVFASLSYLASLPQIVLGGTIPETYVEDPTVYWSIFLLDLGFLLPITIAISVGLLQDRRFAEKALYGTAGWYVLVVGSVASMFVVMFLNGDPNMNMAPVLVLLAIELAVVAFTGWIWHPLVVHRGRPTGDR
jgi:hypothetical protein